MKKNRLSMNLIMVLAMAAVAVCVLVCAIVIFVQTYRSALLRNAETTSRQAIAQVSSTMEEYLEDMNDSVALLTEYLDLPVRQREARFETFLEIKPDVVAITTYDADGQMKTATASATSCANIFGRICRSTRRGWTSMRTAMCPRRT